MPSHVILIRKLQTLNMPPNVYNWIISFLTGREQSVKFIIPYLKLFKLTCRLYKDLGLDHPYNYVIMESDLHPKSINNKLLKYADDTNVLVPENTNCTLLE